MKFVRTLMLRKLLPSLLLALLATCMVCISDATPVANSPSVRHVFIISFDQGNPDLIQSAEMPVFHKMAAEGAHTWQAYTIVPSVTLPSHTSMLTGVGIQQHQVTWNSYEPDKGLVKVPTVFRLAKERGLVTAMFVGKEKFKHLIQPDTVDLFVWPQPEDDAISVAQAFAAEVGDLKPELCFIHFRDPDTVGHAHGAYSREKIQSLEDCDQALEIIRDAVVEAGIIESSVFILTADHGGHDIKDSEGEIRGTHGSADSADVLIPWVAWGQDARKDFKITAPVVQYDTAATALWLLGVPIPETFWGKPVTSAFQ